MSESASAPRRTGRGATGSNKREWNGLTGSSVAGQNDPRGSEDSQLTREDVAHELDDCRVEAARSWFDELLGDLGDGGYAWLALRDGKGWHEAGPFRPGAGMFAKRAGGPLAGLPADGLPDLLAAAAIATAEAGDVFACPYPQAPLGRRKGAARLRRHVHADIDGALDTARVRFVGGMAVASGSVDGEGRPHGHVYLRLDRPVTAAAHEALCRGLARFVGGDFADMSKVADHDVLRVPGTLNHKTTPARPVSWIACPDDPSVRTWAPEDLARVLGMSWPITEPSGEPEPKPVEGAEPSPASANGAQGDVRRRLAALARAVTESPAGDGNATLNWAAGKAGAIVYTTPGSLTPFEVRAALVNAYMARPNRDHKPEVSRRSEAERTAASGWDWGTAHPAKALSDDNRKTRTPAKGDDHRKEDITAHHETDTSMEAMPPQDGSKAPEGPQVSRGWMVPSDELWCTPRLRTIRQAAHSRVLPAPALLMAVLGRVLLGVPPEVKLPPVVASASALNLGVALTGGSGTGKSSILEVSAEVLGSVAVGQRGLERPVGSGEGMAQTFLRFDKELKANVLVDDPRRLITVDEVTSLGSMGSRNGATIDSAIRSGLTGGPLGQENATRELIRHVPAGSYRLVLVVGVQPAYADILLKATDVGTPQRFAWAPVIDPTVPDELVAWPGTLRWQPPAQWPETFDYPDHIKAEIRRWHKRKRQGDDIDPRDGHRMLLRLKLGAALAVLHGQTYITDQWWHLSGLLVDLSDRTQDHCADVLAEKSRQQDLSNGRRMAVRQQGAAEYANARAEKLAERVAKIVAEHHLEKTSTSKHEPGAGCTDRCITQALKNFPDKAEMRGPAVAAATDHEWITEVEGRWLPGDVQPGDDTRK